MILKNHAIKLTTNGKFEIHKLDDESVVLSTNSPTEFQNKLIELLGSKMQINDGWSHEEAKNHTVVERLIERCQTYNGGLSCKQSLIVVEDYCERCLAVENIMQNTNLVHSISKGKSTIQVNKVNELVSGHWDNAQVHTKDGWQDIIRAVRNDDITFIEWQTDKGDLKAYGNEEVVWREKPAHFDVILSVLSEYLVVDKKWCKELARKIIKAFNETDM